jgi:hypothetical protein
MQQIPRLLRPFTGLLYRPWMIDGDGCGAISGMSEWQVKPKYRKEPCPSAALTTTYPKWRHPGSNTGRRGGQPVTDRLSYGTALPLPCNILAPPGSFLLLEKNILRHWNNLVCLQLTEHYILSNER